MKKKWMRLILSPILTSLVPFFLFSYAMASSQGYQICKNIYPDAPSAARLNSSLSNYVKVDLNKPLGKDRNETASSRVTAWGPKDNPNASEKYEVERIIIQYFEVLKFENLDTGKKYSLMDDLIKLESNDYFVDFGSGEGHSLENIAMNASEFFQAFKNSKLVRYSKERPLLNELKYLYENFDPSTNRVSVPVKTNNPKDYSNLFNIKYATELNKFLEFLDQPSDKKPKLLGITYEMFRDDPHRKGLSYLSERLFENIPVHELQKFKLGVQYFGVLSYTKQLSYSLLKIAYLMEKPGARVYVWGVNHRIIAPGIEYNKYYGNQQGNDLAFWINHNPNVSGIKAIYIGGNAWILERTAEPLRIPEIIMEKDISERPNPPTYLFRETGRILIPE